MSECVCTRDASKKTTSTYQKHTPIHKKMLIHAWCIRSCMHVCVGSMHRHECLHASTMLTSILHVEVGIRIWVQTYVHVSRRKCLTSSSFCLWNIKISHAHASAMRNHTRTLYCRFLEMCVNIIYIHIQPYTCICMYIHVHKHVYHEGAFTYSSVYNDIRAFLHIFERMRHVRLQETHGPVCWGQKLYLTG